MKNIQSKKAFSMIELILVMVVLGIVASMGATIIAQVYGNYIMQKGTHDSSTKVELVSSILYNYLSQRIASTTVGRDVDNATNILHVNDITNPDNFEVLEWYGMAVESFGANEADNRPAWSGVCDIESPLTTGGSIDTPGSNLALLSEIASNLSDGGVDDMALIFSSRTFSGALAYNVACMGYSNSNCIVGIKGVDSANSVLLLDQNYTMRVHEQYQLTQSAYAIVPVEQADDGSGRKLYRLDLRYNYQPWNGESYTTAPSKALLDNVSVFRFSGAGDTIRLKICVDERIGEKEYISICKEKAVIR